MRAVECSETVVEPVMLSVWKTSINLKSYDCDE